MNRPTALELAQCIDHTLLKPDAPESALVRLCAEAQEFGFISVCVQPCWARLATRQMEGSPVLVGTVVGFPHGANTISARTFEAKQALRDGAHELDMVVNIGAIKSGAWQTVTWDIEAVVREAQAAGAEVKVILECAYLTDEEKRAAAEIVADSGAGFVKTSTGFGPHGATIEDVRLLRETVGDRCGVKAAGGIRDLTSALAMLEAGANRLGTSAGIAILQALSS